jgi:hypothetical protein
MARVGRASLGAAGLVLGGALALSTAVLVAGTLVVDGQLRSDEAVPLAERAVTQRFTAPVDGLWAVDLLLATYGQQADGVLEATLRGPDGSALGRWRLAGAEIHDNAWHRLRLPAATAGLELAGRELELRLARIEPGERPPATWASGGDAYPAGSLWVDREPAAGDLAFRAIYRPGAVAGAAWLLGTAGYPAVIAACLVFGIFASVLGFLYTLAHS